MTPETFLAYAVSLHENMNWGTLEPQEAIERLRTAMEQVVF